MSNELSVISRDNVAQIARMAPQAFSDNKSSHDKCIAAGQALLDRIHSSGRMDDALDKEAAAYLEKVRKTVRKMNDTRSPVTKLFDEYRKLFTSMENDIDPVKTGTVPAQLQSMRNRYAEEKRAEELRRQQEEYRRQQAENARRQYRAACVDEYRRVFSLTLNAAVDSMSSMNNSVTLANVDEIISKLKSFSCTLPEDWCTRWACTRWAYSLRRPPEMPFEEADRIKSEVMQSLSEEFRSQYSCEVSAYRDDFIYRIPSKMKELEAIAKLNEEEAEARRREMEERDKENAARMEAERREREAEEAHRMAMERKNAEMDSLFETASASVPSYQPKCTVRKKINVLNTEGYLDVFSMWWTNCGSSMTKEELDKVLKTQLTFCEKMANDKNNARYIKSEHIEYVDEVKSR